MLGDAEPLFVLRKFSASKLNELREEALERFGLRSAYLEAFEEADGTQNFLNALQNYPVLKGTQSNLYKCFLPQAWMIGSRDGVSGFLHPEGVYDDPKGGGFRETLYPRLRAHFQFQNQFILFPIGDRVKYSINIYGSSGRQILFESIANLFAPKTVDACIAYEGSGTVPGIKGDDNKWDVRGHEQRVIQVSERELELFAKLYDPEGTPPLQARLPTLHARSLVSVLEKFAAYPHRLGNLQGEYFSTVMWDETNAVKRDGTIRRETGFPRSSKQWVLSGPHFYVGNPFYKTPRAVCTEKAHYDVLDLTELPADYLPRTPKVPWRDRKPVTKFYRVVYRKMLSQSGERTLIAAILPPQTTHIDGCFSIAFGDIHLLSSFAGLCISLLFDFFIKSTGKSKFSQRVSNPAVFSICDFVAEDPSHHVFNVFNEAIL